LTSSWKLYNVHLLIGGNR